MRTGRPTNPRLLQVLPGDPPWLRAIRCVVAVLGMRRTAVILGVSHTLVRGWLMHEGRWKPNAELRERLAPKGKPVKAKERMGLLFAEAAR